MPWQIEKAAPTPLSSPDLITPRIIERLNKDIVNPESTIFRDCNFILYLTDDHSVKIGDRNDFSKFQAGDSNAFFGNRAIGNTHNIYGSTEKNWFEKHPLITSIIAGFIIALLTSSWWWNPLVKMLGIAN